MAFAVQDFDLEEEQREFRDMLRRFFDANAPIAEVRRVVDSDSALSVELWKRCCDELRLPGLAISEAHGGQGFGLVELGLALSEVGRSLAPVPLFASAALAGRAVEASAGDDADHWLRPIADGQIAALAIAEAGGSWQPGEVRVEAKPDGDAFRISGDKHFVLAGRNAERFFVVARAPASRGREGIGLFALDGGAAGVDVRPVSTLDVTRKLATLHLDGALAKPVGVPGDTANPLERALEEATVLLCAEMVGAMGRVLETAVAYAGSRCQFGRAIGSFQAIKHKCADMLVDFEGARTASAAALDAAAADDAERSALASVAKAYAGRAFTRMTTENLQIHGGVGYTWEYDAHLYYRRAKSCEVLLGDATFHHERLAQTLVAEET
jgi:alkylation response protein AidB-like acyl-CoA dehydrogenase